MKLFTAEQFTPTKFGTAEDKAKFANHFVRFVESDFKSTLFPKWFYTRLSMTFGHIAHYNQSGFYSEFFASTMDKVRFLEQTRLAGCYGSPEHTYCDVERVIVKWVRDSGVESLYREQLAEEIKAKELAELARLRAKYSSIPVACQHASRFDERVCEALAEAEANGDTGDQNDN